MKKIGFTDMGSFFGGNANNGANAGFGYLNANNRPANANANIGARLRRIGASLRLASCVCATLPLGKIVIRMRSVSNHTARTLQ